MSLNIQLDQIQQSATVAVADHILKLKSQGKNIISLQVGDPDFPTPPQIVDAAIKALHAGFTHYGPSRGFTELRESIAAKLTKNNLLEQAYDPNEEILVTHGGVHAYYLAMQSILNPGDEALIPDPGWATHSNMVKLLRGNVVSVPGEVNNNFIPSLSAWKNSLTKKTRAIVINYPANPTGGYPSRDYLEQLLDFAENNDLWVVSDEVYTNLFFEEKPVSLSEFPEFKDRIIIINSLSKTYAMTGWRVGFLAASSRVINNALKASQNSITCVAPFIQKAAAFALTDDSIQEEVEKMRLEYGHRRKMVMQIFKERKVPLIGVNPPKGAFYFFLDFRNLNRPSQEICSLILDDKGVGLTPGSAFGRQGEGFIRMSIAASDSDIEAGFEAILDWTNHNKDNQ